MKIKAFKESKCRKKMFKSIWSIRIICNVMKNGIGYFDNLKIIYIKNFFLMKQILSNNDFRMISFVQSFTNIDD